jgi:hypothetical protein
MFYGKTEMFGDLLKLKNAPDGSKIAQMTVNFAKGWVSLMLLQNKPKA